MLTGTAKPRKVSKILGKMRNNAKGFTLIEIMVVIVIVALIAGTVMLSFPPVGDKLLKEHAERFSALISLAQDEAILQSTEYALEVTPTGYSFYFNDNNRWQKIDEPPFAPRTLPSNISSKMYLDGISIDLKNRAKSKPQVVILSSGEMTPFTYTLTFNNQSEITLKVDANGKLEKNALLNGESE